MVPPPHSRDLTLAPGPVLSQPFEPEPTANYLENSRLLKSLPASHTPTTQLQ